MSTEVHAGGGRTARCGDNKSVPEIYFHHSIKKRNVMIEM